MMDYSDYQVLRVEEYPADALGHGTIELMLVMHRDTGKYMVLFDENNSSCSFDSLLEAVHSADPGTDTYDFEGIFCSTYSSQWDADEAFDKALQALVLY